MTLSPSPQELRHDVLNGRQTIVAAARRQRPMRTASSHLPAPEITENDDPFCEGHEHHTPNERLALRPVNTAANQPGWLLRVVPNRYPVVNEPGSLYQNGLTGIHDVVIECPDSRCLLADLTSTEIARILTAWQIRIRRIRTQPDVRAISVFRNEGNGAGASLPHCHSQILATNFLSRQLQQRVHNKDAFQSWLDFERQAQTRIVDESDALITLCPFASRVDWATRFVPRSTSAALEELTRFEEMPESQIIELATQILTVVTGLQKVIGDFDHNLTLVLPPVRTPLAFPWMLDLLPRRSRFAGFEVLTDTDIITVAPEFAAEKLRGACHFGTEIECSDQVQPFGYGWSEDESGSR